MPVPRERHGGGRAERHRIFPGRATGDDLRHTCLDALTHPRWKTNVVRDRIAVFVRLPN
jgi:hypothetical protein